MVILYWMSAGSGGAAGAGLGEMPPGRGGWATVAAALAGAGAGGEPGAGGVRVMRGGMGVPACGWLGAGGPTCAAATIGRAISKDNEKTVLSFIMSSWV